MLIRSSRLRLAHLLLLINIYAQYQVIQVKTEGEVFLKRFGHITAQVETVGGVECTDQPPDRPANQPTDRLIPVYHPK